MNFRLVFSLGVMGLLLSCEEPFQLDLDQAEQKIVIEGLVTDQPGMQSVKITRSTEFYSSGNTPRVIDAVVTVTDNVGNVYNYIHNPRSHADSAGIYIPQVAFKGVVGRTYKLRVEADGELYEAEDVLVDVSPIDSISYQIDEDEVDDPKVEGKIYEPLLFIKEPKESDNFYLLKFYRNDTLTYYAETDIYYSDDDLLAENIDGVPGPTIYGVGDKIRAEIYSISRVGYVFYNDLSTLLNNDGGMFGPVPASPRSNISNDALGFFQVSAVKSAAILLESE